MIYAYHHNTRRSSLLQHSCSITVQHATVQCSTAQHTSAHCRAACNTLQHTAAALQYTPANWSKKQKTKKEMQHTATDSQFPRCGLPGHVSFGKTLCCKDVLNHMPRRLEWCCKTSWMTSAMISSCWMILQDALLETTQCNALKHTAAHWSKVQHIAAQCITLQHTAAHCSTLQRTSAQCSTLQRTATNCNELQRTATPCCTLQRSNIL